MRNVTQTGAGREMEHHQGELQRPVLSSGAVGPASPTSGAPRAEGDQLDLIAPTPSPSPTRRRSKAARVAAFFGRFGLFEGDEQARALLEHTARADERRAHRRERGSV
jgi:hypothetical protein